MGRAPRVWEKGAVYHVVPKGNDGRPIFLDDRDRVDFLVPLHEAAEAHGAVIVGYCLMKNHVHWLIQSGEEGLSAFLRDVLGGSLAPLEPPPRPRGAHLEEPHVRPPREDRRPLLVRRPVHRHEPGRGRRRPPTPGLAVEQLPRPRRPRRAAPLPRQRGVPHLLRPKPRAGAREVPAVRLRLATAEGPGARPDPGSTPPRHGCHRGGSGRPPRPDPPRLAPPFGATAARGQDSPGAAVRTGAPVASPG